MQSRLVPRMTPPPSTGVTGRGSGQPGTRREREPFTYFSFRQLRHVGGIVSCARELGLALQQREPFGGRSEAGRQRAVRPGSYCPSWT